MNSKLFARTLVSLSIIVGLVACNTPPPPQPLPTIVVTSEVTRVVTATPESGAEVTPVASVPVPTVETGTSGPLLRVAVNTYPATLDPQLASQPEEQALLQLMYEGLTRLDGNLQPQPGAAEAWTVDDDGLTLIFRLRAGLTYADGTPLNARRFVYALKRALDPHTAALHGAWLDDIEGAPAWRTADPNSAEADLLKLEGEVGLQALDANNKPCRPAPDGYAQADCVLVRITLARASGVLLTMLALPIGYPVREESVKDARTGSNWWQNSRLQNGNGPFTLTRLEPYVNATLKRNTRYWGGAPALNGIELSFLSEPGENLARYRAGQVDIAPLSVEDLAAVRDEPTLSGDVQVYPGRCSVGYFFNLQAEPFDNIAVRRAVAQGVDRAAWVGEVDQGFGLLTDSWVPQGIPGSVPAVEGWPFDPTVARDALVQAGFPGGQDLPAITLKYPATARGKARTEFLAGQFLANLDVRAKLDPLDPEEYTKAVESAETLPQFYRVGHCAEYPDPTAWLDVLFKSDAESALRQGYTNPDVDALLASAYAEYDPAQRAALYQQAQQQIIRDLPLLVMDNVANTFLVRQTVSGVAYTAMDSVLPGAYEPLRLSVRR